MVKIVDISKKSGCSIAAVSRVLSPNPHKDARVAQKTRKHILKIASEMGYRPNRNAEFLKRGGTPTIGVFLPRISNNLITELVFGLSTVASAERFPLSLSFDMSYKSYKEFLDENIQSRNCGIISYPWFNVDSKAMGLIDEYTKKGGKMILLDVEGNQGINKLKKKITHISINDYQGGEIAAERLLTHSCSTYINLVPRYHRSSGFQDFLKKAGITDMVTIKEYDHELKENETGLKKLYEIIKKSSPAGIFATADESAMMAMTYLLNKGLKITEDFFIIGYGNQYLTEWTSPKLTTIRQPFYEVGKLAVEKLIKLIYEKPVESECLSPVLVQRNTA